MSQSSDSASSSFGLGQSPGFIAPRFSVTSRRSADYEFHFDQENLEELCKDRELETVEIHPANDFYGQATILKEYAGWPKATSLKGIIEHAPQYNETMWEYDRDQKLPLVLVTNKQRGEVCRRLAKKPVQMIGFSGCYASRLLDDGYGEPVDEQRKGTLVFPCHSSHLCKAEYSHERYAEAIAKLPDRMKPATICIYWRDFLWGAHQPYRDRGMRVVTAGHMYDHDFMFRISDLLRQFRFAISNEMGTHVLLSILNGCTFSYLPSDPIEYKWDTDETASANQVFRDEMCESVTAESQRLFAKVGQPIEMAQREFVERILGFEHVLSPERLRNVFRRAERMDRFVPRDLRTGPKWHRLLPPALQRQPQPLRYARRAVKQRIKRLIRGESKRAAS